MGEYIVTRPLMQPVHRQFRIPTLIQQVFLFFLTLKLLFKNKKSWPFPVLGRFYPALPVLSTFPWIPGMSKSTQRDVREYFHSTRHNMITHEIIASVILVTTFWYLFSNLAIQITIKKQDALDFSTILSGLFYQPLLSQPQSALHDNKNLCDRGWNWPELQAFITSPSTCVSRLPKVRTFLDGWNKNIGLD